MPGHRLRDHRQPPGLPEPHRPRARSVGDLGPAAAAAGRDGAGSPVQVQGPTSAPSTLDVRLEAPDLCPRYCAQVFEVTIGPSPEWLARAARGRRRPPDQQHRRRHQLRDARARPADARLRSRTAGGPGDRRPAGAPRRADPHARRHRPRPRTGHAGDRRRASARSRSAA